MGIFASSSTFVGRSAELAALRAAYQDENVTTVLISGEAGIGKSRLVQEFTSRLGPTPLVLTGRCLEFGNDGLPFAPFLSPLRSLSAAPGDFGEVITVLERSAETRPLILVLEDLHWADRSSLQLLTFLVANVAHSGVLLVSTHRAPSGPLRQLVAELTRLPVVRPVTPGPLTRHETGRQLAALLSHEPEPALVTRVFERSRGNPLFVEALSSSPEDPPAELRELLLAGLPELTADAHQVLTVASVAGTDVEHQVLAAVSDLPEPQLHQALRHLVDKHVLLATDFGYSFRHALIQRALYDRLLPVERTQLHARFAATLSAMPQRVAQLAAHAYAAGDHALALTAAWEAAGQAKLSGAEPERMHLLERVLELWDTVESPPGLDRLTVLDHAVETSLATSAVDSGLRWSAEALAIAPHPHRFHQRARLRNLGRSGGRDDLLTALELLPEPSLPRGQVLADLAISSVFAGDAVQGERHARAALEIAEQLSDTALMARAHAYLGLAAADPETARHHFTAARAIADRHTVIDVATWESAFYVAMGAYADAIEVVQVGLRAAHESFQYAKHAPILMVKWVQALTALGRWAEALDLIDEALGETELPQLSHAALLISRGGIHLAQGDEPAARAAAETAAQLLGDEPWVRPYRIRLCALKARLEPGTDHTLDPAALAAHPHEAWALLAAVRPAELPDLPVAGPVDEAYRAMASGDLEGAAQGWRALGQPYELSLCTPHAEPPAPQTPKRAPGLRGLTAREMEVLHLVADGKSNRQIAAELFISGNTAGVHVSRILTKLGAATRTEAARKLFDATMG